MRITNRPAATSKTNPTTKRGQRRSCGRRSPPSFSSVDERLMSRVLADESDASDASVASSIAGTPTAW
jgi:hypothetical protein